ncbi:MAG: 23S rRNA (adenine(2503)-C(2))-methyltransferase RlmN [Bacteroidetes Order II. Incertae sedis bacterium]|jgi:23S rRNA (adenine2503-C2)-methyltransferase|nr:23S rRNA (adenine(2503)-C(2))-methyltransferase RlmN [Bacteroidetes Order II. bacterium]MBT4602010.1 23S rRNA (adenine(2503)-C(2))-methyltransferase RlmN [Bacteroidetes Order II. bacterium]MBT5250362.1 23S rRNA (adenine(2503)-C(2))-methyltransferase RlmN [Bacteroidetes Order II. bacterium]MBT6201139.1 23S rRNA (adenine(2503)-C(2))-methyltransferase RlmN [Bacteroidetes Order II. bacterium]MBT6424729.1 23S rRNA (adenine(2503)-C(2))-methyltransferase RlmN [Bacteroidetes Order II. bacterium]
MAHDKETSGLLDILSMSRDQLQTWVLETDKSFRSKQIYRWLWKQGVRSFDEMKNLPDSLRRRLKDETEFRNLELVQQQTASDRTEKLLFKLSTGRLIETVLIPDIDPYGNAKRLTVCVSSQVGCAMACSFCATGQMGFLQNLTSGEIFDQVRLANDLAIERFDSRITNIVFMGMGEPLLNPKAVLDSVEKLTSEDGMGLGSRRITVSTVGLAGRIRELADLDVKFNLAVSLHAPFDDKRSSIMPVNRKARTDLVALMDSIEYYTRQSGRTVTYEYCMFQGYNDSVEDAAELARLVARAPAKVNLIMYNPVEGLLFQPSSEKVLNQFIARLVRDRVTVTVRRSRGQDIDAACGQLATKSMES